MLSKPHENRAARILPGVLLVLFATFGNAAAVRADVKTLFTTTQERQIINSNRYKVDEITRSPVFEDAETEFIAPVIREEFKISFVITGITVSKSGPHFVWVNNQLYEDGEHLEDNSQIKVLHDGSVVRVRITAPDGKRYYGTSGETVEVTYLAEVVNLP
jgi:hypothetical protein